MLILSRKRGEAIAIGDHESLQCDVKVTVLEVNGARVKLGFEAVSHLAVHRWEVWERIRSENQTPSWLPAAVEDSTDCWDDDGGP